MFDWHELNAEVIAEFRANDGKVARFGDLPVAILHTLGAKSGLRREIPLIVVREGEQVLIFGTKAGSPTHPAWYYNLKAHPRIEIELGDERFIADVVEVPEAESEVLIGKLVNTIPRFAAYVESAAPRRVPVFSIERV